MFLQVTNTRGFLEALNIEKIVKIYEMSANQTRINMVDGTYTVTNANTSELHREAEMIMGGV